MAHTRNSTEARIHTGANWRLRLETITTASTQSLSAMTTDSAIDYRDPNGTTGSWRPITLDSTRFVYYDITSETTVSGWWWWNTRIVVGGSTFFGNAYGMRLFRPGYDQ